MIRNLRAQANNRAALNKISTFLRNDNMHPSKGFCKNSAESASFLWEQRSAAIEQPNYKSGDMLELELRIDAMLDSLMTSLDMAWEICSQPLKKCRQAY